MKKAYEFIVRKGLHLPEHMKTAALMAAFMATAGMGGLSVQAAEVPIETPVKQQPVAHDAGEQTTTYVDVSRLHAVGKNIAYNTLNLRQNREYVGLTPTVQVRGILQSTVVPAYGNVIRRPSLNEDGSTDYDISRDPVVSYAVFSRAY